MNVKLILLFFLFIHCDLETIPDRIVEENRLVAKFSSNNNCCIAPCEVSFLNESENGDSFEWDFDDGMESSDENPKHLFEEPGLYNVQLRIFEGSSFDDTITTVLVKKPKTYETWESVGTGTCDFGYAGTTTFDGGYVITGASSANNGGVLLMKADSCGNTRTYWPPVIRDLGNDNKLDKAYDIIETSDNGYVITGYIQTKNSRNDIFLLKFGIDGVLEWEKSYSISNQDDIGFSVDEIPNIGFVIGGVTRDENGNSRGCFIKTNLEGDSLNTKIDSEENTAIYDVKALTESTYIATGVTMLGAARFLKIDNMFVYKEDESLNNFLADSKGTSIISLPSSGGFLIVGKYRFNSSGFRLFSWRLNENANHSGPVRYEFDNSTEEIVSVEGGDITIADDGGFVIASTVLVALGDNHASLMKIGNDLKLEWLELYSPCTFGYSVSKVESGYILSGEACGQIADFEDVYIVRTNHKGEIFENCN